LYSDYTRGVVHNDIKPSNIIVHETGKLYLVDFESAGFPDCNPHDSIYTEGFVAPERVYTKSCSLKSDVFSLGIMLAHQVCYYNMKQNFH